MALPIVTSRTISGSVDNRAKLANSNIARTWSSYVGTNWTTIRIGCRLSITDSGANIISTPRFAFGICSGTSNIFMDATTTHFFGIVSYNATWTRTTSPVKYMLGNGSYFDSGIAAAKRIGSTLTTDAFSNSPFPGATYLFDSADGNGNRVVLFLDITKGSPNFSIKPFYYKGGGTPVDVSTDTFLANMEYTSPAITGHAIGNETKTMAIDEATNCYFNAVNIAWDRTTPAIEISDVAVVRFS